MNQVRYLRAPSAQRVEPVSATPYRQFVSKNPSRTSYFQPVLDLLEYRPSDLEAVPDVVLVEGKTDFYLLRWFQDVLGLRPMVRLVPGGGAGSLDTLIRLYIGWGATFAVLLDGDAEGERQTERYIREFGPIVKGRLLNLGEISSPNARAIEGLLSSADRDLLVEAVFHGRGSRPSAKKALHSAILELYGLFGFQRGVMVASRSQLGRPA